MIWFCWFISVFTFLGGRGREAITFSYCKAETKEVALFSKILNSNCLTEQSIAKYQFFPSLHPHIAITGVAVRVAVESKGCNTQRSLCPLSEGVSNNARSRCCPRLQWLDLGISATVKADRSVPNSPVPGGRCQLPRDLDTLTGITSLSGASSLVKVQKSDFHPVKCTGVPFRPLGQP